MKRETLQKHTKIANDILFYIYTHIDTAIDLTELSEIVGVSKFHMHRIFKEQFGVNIYENVQDIRLQKASSMLLTNKLSTISEIANVCGYSSHSTFIHAFKKRFSMSPKAWRNGGYLQYASALMRQSGVKPSAEDDFETLQPTIEKRPALQSYYIRHKGYGPQLAPIWQKLQTLQLSESLEEATQVALFHDNVTITPLDEIRYVACLSVEEAHVPNNRLPKFEIASGVYARFDISGDSDYFIRFKQWVYNTWLPSSEYETTTKPSYAVYKKNNFLREDAELAVSFYISIRF